MNENTVFEYSNSIGTIRFAMDSPYWIEEITGISGVEVELYESHNAGQIGTTITGRRINSRSITINGCIFEPLDETRPHLLEVIAPAVPSTLTRYDSEGAWFLDVEPESTPEVSAGNGVQDFQLMLRAANPRWRSVNELSSMVAGLVAMFKFPFYTGGSWYISKFTEDYFKVIHNPGNMPIEFTALFVARAELDNPELMHIETGKVIRLRKKMLAGETLAVSTIDGQRGVVAVDVDGKVTNGFRYLSPESDLSMAILPGDNQFRADAGSHRERLSVYIRHPEGVKSGG